MCYLQTLQKRCYRLRIKNKLYCYDASISLATVRNAITVDYFENNGRTFIAYYYLRNAQNDVVKLIDGSGNAVIEYIQFNIKHVFDYACAWIDVEV